VALVLNWTVPEPLPVHTAAAFKIPPTAEEPVADPPIFNVPTPGPVKLNEPTEMLFTPRPTVPVPLRTVTVPPLLMVREPVVATPTASAKLPAVPSTVAETPSDVVRALPAPSTKAEPLPPGNAPIKLQLVATNPLLVIASEPMPPGLLAVPSPRSNPDEMVVPPGCSVPEIVQCCPPRRP